MNIGLVDVDSHASKKKWGSTILLASQGIHVRIIF